MHDAPIGVVRKQLKQRSIGRNQHHVYSVTFHRLTPSGAALKDSEVVAADLIAEEVASAVDENPLLGVSGPEKVVAPLVGGEDPIGCEFACVLACHGDR